ncbi:MAG: hypothetical protein Q8T09_11680 [Candidatus Melainabacteria bacterium]|nr:hypothetical protein [Candidatus Melainabacteria bacterium]
MFLNNQSDKQENTDAELKAEADLQNSTENISAIDLGLNSQMDYPILNFFGGSVRTDRVEHENVSRRAGLARWNRNIRDTTSYTEQVEHAGFSPARSSSNQAQRSTAGYGVSAQSPGMGLESENLQSFITGSHHIAYQMPSSIPETQVEPQQQQQQEQQERDNTAATEGTANHTELPSGAPAPAIVYKFRRMKTKTFHKLLAMAMNE